MAFVYVSNILGTVNPVTQITQRAREVGALSVVDALQAVPQPPVDVAALGADFVAFTGSDAGQPASVSCGGAASCSMRCRRSSVAAR